MSREGIAPGRRWTEREHATGLNLGVELRKKGPFGGVETFMALPCVLERPDSRDARVVRSPIVRSNITLFSLTSGPILYRARRALYHHLPSVPALRAERVAVLAEK